MKAQIIYKPGGIEIAGYDIMCPGCKREHYINTGENIQGSTWNTNGDTERPTFIPSLLLDQGTYRCHSFVENGNIRFLDDCTHSLKGQTVELPEIE